LAGKIDVSGGLLDVGKYRGTQVGKRLNRRAAVGIQSNIKRRFEFMAHSWDTAYYICAIGGTAIPSIDCTHGSFDPNQGCARICTSNGDSFIEVTEESLGANGFVVAAGRGVQLNAEEFTSVGKDAAERAAMPQNVLPASTTIRQHIPTFSNIYLNKMQARSWA
jgi:hypothetical protein